MMEDHVVEPATHLLTNPSLLDLEALMQSRIEQSLHIPQVFFSAEAENISQACWSMARRFHQGGRLLAFGNGACATDAQHVAVEFVHPVIVGKRALPAIALTNDGAFLSSRETGTEGVAFDRQIAILARPHDIAMAFSVNGQDSNLFKALVTAKTSGLLTLGLTGRDAGHLADAELDFCFSVPSQDAMLVQETHEMLYHVLWELVHIFFEHEGLLK
jgi:D-sedoheptulose 7-phosphate isomerase